MSRVKVSVVVPIYNSEEYLYKCIESILNQTYRDLELILIDDGSMDKSADICREYESKDDRIRFFQQKNSGASEARNLGLKYINGNYLMFVDADDHIELNMIEKLVQKAESENADFVMCGMVVDLYHKTGIKKSSIYYEPVQRVITGNSNIPDKIIDLVEDERISGPYCKLIRSKIIKDNNLMMPPHISLQEDLYFNLKVMEKINKMCVIPDALYHYNQGLEESVTTRYYNSKYEMTNEVHDLLMSYYKNRSQDRDILGRVMYIYIKNTYAAFINLFHPDCKLVYKEKLKYIKGILNSPKFNEMVKHSQKEGIKYNILKFILYTKNKIFIFYCSKMFYLLKNKFGLRY